MGMTIKGDAGSLRVLSAADDLLGEQIVVPAGKMHQIGTELLFRQSGGIRYFAEIQETIVLS